VHFVLTIYLYSAHRAVIFAIAQLSCYYSHLVYVSFVTVTALRIVDEGNKEATYLLNLNVGCPLLP